MGGFVGSMSNIEIFFSYPNKSQGFSFYHKTLKFAYKVRQRRDMKKFEIKVEIRV